MDVGPDAHESMPAKRSPARRFHALYDKVYREDFLRRGWEDVRRNRGAPGVDGVTIDQVEERGVEEFLGSLAGELEDGTYRPLPVRRVTISKPDGGERNLGVPAVRDRVVQAAARAVLEPIFEADFLDCSYGFRPRRSSQQALETIRMEVNKGRGWVVETDIASFFDTIRWDVLDAALRERISDRRVLKLIRGWLTAGVLVDGSLLHPEAGTPQGGVASPLLANVVLHRLDREWQQHHRRLGVLVRFADDLVVVCATRERAVAALAALRHIVAELGLEMKEAKTRTVNLREHGQGVDFLGYHHRWVESFTRKGRYFCARWPSDRAVRAARTQIRARTDRRLLMLPVGLTCGFVVEGACFRRPKVYYPYMPSIVGKRRGKQTYYYLVESARVDGKPRIVSQEYLGTAEEVMARLQGTGVGLAGPHPAQAVRGPRCGVGDVPQLGGGRHHRRGRRGPPVGRGRVGGDLPGVGDREPDRGPVLEAGVRRLVGDHRGPRFVRPRLPAGATDHRRFWDAMDTLTETQLVEIERRLSLRAIELFGLDLSGLVLDMTNFATFIDSANDRAPIAKRGKAKQKRHDLRLVGLALVVTSDGAVPVVSHPYPGNRHDSTQFTGLLDEIVDRWRRWAAIRPS
jgi:RNA-directed DNA polymerase